MANLKTTYRKLFRFLESLGFSEERGNTPNRRAFIHEPSDTQLLFGRGLDEQVTPADMLSADVHLAGNGLIDKPLEELLNSGVVTGS